MEPVVATINEYLPIATALLGGLLFIWRVTHNLNKTLIILNENINELNSTSKMSKSQIDNHEIRIVILETVTGVKPVINEALIKKSESNT